MRRIQSTAGIFPLTGCPLAVETSSQVESIVIACRDPLFGGALASAVVASSLRVAALVDSLDDISSVVENGSADAIVVVNPHDFPPELLAEVGVPVLVIGTGDDAEAMIASVEAGALGYADLSESLESMVDAIKSVIKGVPVIPPLLLGSLLRHVVERQRSQRQARERLDVLSTRERQVFELAARGYDRQGMADELFISSATVRTHVQNAFRKLDLHSMAELVALASDCGLDVGSSDKAESE